MDVTGIAKDSCNTEENSVTLNITMPKDASAGKHKNTITNNDKNHYSCVIVNDVTTPIAAILATVWMKDNR